MCRNICIECGEIYWNWHVHNGRTWKALDCVELHGPCYGMDCSIRKEKELNPKSDIIEDEDDSLYDYFE